jgi:hypothetical protein
MLDEAHVHVLGMLEDSGYIYGTEIRWLNKKELCVPSGLGIKGAKLIPDTRPGLIGHGRKNPQSYYSQ